MNTTPPTSNEMSPLDEGTQRAGLVKREESPDSDCALISITKWSDKNMAEQKIVIDLDGDEVSIVPDHHASTEQTVSTTNQPKHPSFHSNFTNIIPVKKEELEDEEDSKEKLKHELNCAITTEKFLEAIVVQSESEDEDEAWETKEDKEDFDFNPDINSENDDSDSSEAREKRQKLRLHASMSAEDMLETLENERNRLVYKQSQGTKLSSIESQKLDYLSKRIEKLQNELEAKPRESPPKTAREYWQRQLRRDEEQEENKRKREGEEHDPKKARKTSAQTRPGGVTESSSSSMAVSLLTSSNAQTEDSGTSVLPMDQIQATTHAAQLKQIINGIPEGFDTRHTRTQKKDLVNAKQSFGYKKVKAMNGKWLLKGMLTPLKAYQIVGACWMTRREAMELHPPGGILADEMGLGKTITALATIIGHPPEKEDKKEFSAATLIIADTPQSAERAWMGQINEHAGRKIAEKAMIYSKSIGKKTIWWGNRLMVVTHLDELRAQYPSKKELQELKVKSAGDNNSFQRDVYRKSGPLFKINWYRVILDEAQGIKNHTSRAALTAWQLKAKYRWALTGTPLSNKLEEFYPYLKFIGCDFTTSMRNFRAQYIRSKQAAQNFEAMASVVMLRRKQAEKFMGHCMVALPKSHRSDIWVPLTSWEKILNQVVDIAYKEKLEDEQDDVLMSDGNDEENDIHDNADVVDDAGDSDAESEAEFEKDGNVDSDVPNRYRLLNVRCLRLVQLVSHPLNLEKFFREDNRDKEIQSALGGFKSDINQTSDSTDQKDLKEALGPEYLPGLEQLEKTTMSAFGGVKDMAMLLNLAANEQSIKDMICGLCRKKVSLEKPVRNLNCEHVYCELCLILALDSKKSRGGRPLTCRQIGCSAKLAKGEYINTPGSIDAAVKAIKGSKEPGRDSIGTRWRGRADELISFFRAVCGRKEVGSIKMPIGSKLKATLAVLLSWQKEAPDDKIIVYIQWTRSAKALGCILESMGMNFLYYNRMATKKQKNRALDEFTHNPEIKILVASMKCGGQSLNLQMANRAIIVDEWWNKAVEEQAFRRIFRTGQTKETHLVRIMAKETIDERIVMLQEAKEEIIASALQDNELRPHFTGDLQLRMLFSKKDAESLRRDMEKEARGPEKDKQK
ncbi:hypothetical protein ACHAPI_008630 [Fusarium lateritium]